MTSLDRAFMKVFADAPAAKGRADGPHAPHTNVAAAQRKPLAVTAEREPLAAAAHSPHRPRESFEPLAPLSTFAAATKPETPAQAGVEVDELAWSKACCDVLEQAARAWDRFADQLCQRLSEGSQCIAIASCTAGDGRTTVALATAKHLATRGVRTVVVDANFEHPNLAESCRITPQAGWADVVEGECALNEVLISALTDGIALLPWQGRHPHAEQPSDTVRIGATFETLKEQYDLVLLDTGPLVSPEATTAFATLATAAQLDAVYLLSDARSASEDALAAVCANLRQAGLDVPGVIENFANPASLRHRGARLKLHALVGRLLPDRG